MRRRTIEELAHIAELVWSWRLAQWVQRLRRDQEQVRRARQSRPPRTPDAAALWQRFARRRDEKLEHLQELVLESTRGVAAARRRLGIAQARRRAASRIARREEQSQAREQVAEIEIWALHKALRENLGKAK